MTHRCAPSRCNVAAIIERFACTPVQAGSICTAATCHWNADQINEQIQEFLDSGHTLKETDEWMLIGTKPVADRWIARNCEPHHVIAISVGRPRMSPETNVMLDEALDLNSIDPDCILKAIAADIDLETGTLQPLGKPRRRPIR